MIHCDGGYTTNLPVEDLRGRQGDDRHPLRRRSPVARSTAVPRGCSCRTSTSGRAPSGRGGCASWRTTSRASGSRTATTCTAIPGRSSATPVTEAGPDGGQGSPWHVAEVSAVVAETPRVKTLVLDVPGWPGHRPGQHVAVRLTGEDGSQAQRDYSIASEPEAPHAGPHRRAHRRRRGVTLPRGRGAAGRPVRAARTRSAGTSSWTVALGRPAVPGRGGLGGRAAHGHAAPPGGGRQRRAGGPALFLADARGRDLSRRARRAWRPGATGSGSSTRSPGGAGRAGAGGARGSTARCWPRSGFPRRASADLRLRPDEPRRVGRRSRCWTSATSPRGIKTERFGPSGS